ncbi:hypothetical protein I2W78_05400 [Streptomyces spinoverrucosus]|uniref:hypothetical protein n=1 Tax=Streptomyces spinoverrucosus TaxID=284043 RepID=UPI0018C36F55|nr:hypothetical protein [Streptomyces spinoverrucosus]MBG0851306.1 hypothetical protein [Streptomyces spinoverrucosus]
MAVEQLPAQVREFANYLNGLLARLDQDVGWCAVFWQRDPEGMQACLDGREVPPWDVVEALLQDLAAEYGPEVATPEKEPARSLHAAALIAYDTRPGGRDALGDRLDVMLREQRYAAERLAELGRLLPAATSQEDADAVRLDLAWARDDHDRATARCAELRWRMAELARRSVGGQVRGAQLIRPRAPGERQGQAPVRPTEPDPYDPRAAQASEHAHDWAPAPEGQRRAAYDPARADETRQRGAHGSLPAHEGRHGAAFDPARAEAARQRTAHDWAPAHEAPPPAYAPAPEGPQPPAYAPPPPEAPHPTAYAPAPPPERSHPTAYAPAPTPDPPQPAPPDLIPRNAAPPDPTPPNVPRPQPAASAPTPAPDSPRPAPKSRKRRRGGARFAGMVEEEGAPTVVPPGAVPVLPAPEATTGRSPRGARFAGVAEEAVEGSQPQVEPVDAAAWREVAGVVETLVRLRGEGRTGEAHVLLVEAAYWPAARFPLLAAEMERAGLGADWATLLWEAASLPAEQLVAAADALVAAGRDVDAEQILRQGVGRPADEIGRAVLGLAHEGRRREVRALLDAYVRVRTPEEAARSAEPDPQTLVPLLLEAAQGVSAERHWDLVHALRVAGLTT